MQRRVSSSTEVHTGFHVLVSNSSHFFPLLGVIVLLDVRRLLPCGLKMLDMFIALEVFLSLTHKQFDSFKSYFGDLLGTFAPILNLGHIFGYWGKAYLSRLLNAPEECQFFQQALFPTLCVLETPCPLVLLDDPCPNFSKTSLNIWKFTVHILLKPGLENFEHYFTSVWDECNCAVVWTFFGIAFLWDWNENWPFLVLWPLLSFPNLLAYWVQHIHSIIFQDLK